jgi:hypothetical protein
MPTLPRSIRARVVLVLVLALVGPPTACGLGPEPTPVELASVAEAPAHFEAERLSFSGTAKPELFGRNDWINTSSAEMGNSVSSKHSMFVVPVVPEGWTPADPVPLWITRPGIRADDPGPWLVETERVATERVTGRVVDFAKRDPSSGLGRKQSGWQKAIRAAEAEHGIRSDPHAPIVTWPEKS